MLVLTRSKGQKVKIGHDIVITVVQIQGGRVRLGFKAPENIRILRDEIDDENPPQDITVACNTG